MSIRAILIDFHFFLKYPIYLGWGGGGCFASVRFRPKLCIALWEPQKLLKNYENYSILFERKSFKTFLVTYKKYGIGTARH